uniref:Uncharacterized protein LOC116937130 n=1 Tax=Petromyzon marinus TaxID=7757 RepID=A0AAJ7SKC6_PETMA
MDPRPCCPASPPASPGLAPAAPRKLRRKRRQLDALVGIGVGIGRDDEEAGAGAGGGRRHHRHHRRHRRSTSSLARCRARGGHELLLRSGDSQDSRDSRDSRDSGSSSSSSGGGGCGGGGGGGGKRRGGGEWRGFVKRLRSKTLCCCCCSRAPWLLLLALAGFCGLAWLSWLITALRADLEHAQGQIRSLVEANQAAAAASSPGELSSLTADVTALKQEVRTLGVRHGETRGVMSGFSSDLEELRLAVKASPDLTRIEQAVESLRSETQARREVEVQLTLRVAALEEEVTPAGAAPPPAVATVATATVAMATVATATGHPAVSKATGEEIAGKIAEAVSALNLSLCSLLGATELRVGAAELRLGVAELRVGDTELRVGDTELRVGAVETVTQGNGAHLRSVVRHWENVRVCSCVFM